MRARLEYPKKSVLVRSLFTTIVASTPKTLAVFAVLVGLIGVVAIKGFGLTVFGAFALYFVLWWTFLFAVLPFGNQSEGDPDKVVTGQDPGAPAIPRLREKALVTTLVAAVAFFVALIVFPLTRL